jgi:hypothetical protein
VVQIGRLKGACWNIVLCEAHAAGTADDSLALPTIEHGRPGIKDLLLAAQTLMKPGFSRYGFKKFNQIYGLDEINF